MEEKLKVLDGLVNQALDMLYERDMHLIMNRAVNSRGKDEQHHVGERSIVFRFAHYLQNLMDETGEFKEFTLDCEYNRNGAECKSLPSFPNGTYPDLIIHKRGSNDFNLLVMEFKTHWNRDTADDKRKLREFTFPLGKYKFHRGYSVVIERERANIRLVQFPQIGGNE